ncbi:unnamed protein product, partial [Didymodactylos carnosus]
MERRCIDDPKTTTSLRYLDVGDEPKRLLSPIENYEKVKLLTLEKAVKPIEHLFRNLPAWVYVAKQNCQNPVDGLTQDESAAIFLYTMDWTPSKQSLYYQLNQTLRSEDREKLIPWFSYLKLFLTALYTLPSVKSVVWRGIKADISEQFNTGQTFVWWGVSSCTRSVHVLELEKFLGQKGTRTLFNIECKEGKIIRAHSHFSIEDEVVLMPASFFEVIGKNNAGNGLYIVHVRQIEPPVPLIQPPFEIVETETESFVSEPINRRIIKDPIATTIHMEGLNLSNEKNINQIVTKALEEITLATVPVKRKLNFAWEKLGDEGLKMIANTLSRNSTFLEIDLRDNNLSESGAETIGDLLRVNNIWIELCVGHNQIGDKGAEFIAEGLKLNNTLVNLFLTGNGIGNEGARALSSMLNVNKSLKWLSITENQISDDGVISIANALMPMMNTTLTHLYLNKNQIGDQGAIALAGMLLKNQTLKCLGLPQNIISDAGASTLTNALTTNNSLD